MPTNKASPRGSVIQIKRAKGTGLAAGLAAKPAEVMPGYFVYKHGFPTSEHGNLSF